MEWGRLFSISVHESTLKMCQFKAEFTAKHGKIAEVSIDYGGQGVDRHDLHSSLLSRELHKVTDWDDVLPPFVDNDGKRHVTLGPGTALNQLFGGGSYDPSLYIRE
jgi:lipoate-protein ligase A